MSGIWKPKNQVDEAILNGGKTVTPCALLEDFTA